MVEFTEEPLLTWRERFLGFVLPEQERSPNPVMFGGRCILFLMLLWWTKDLVRTDLGAIDALDTFLHGPYLVFHEAGHVIFSLFGEFLTIAGGSIMQVLIPLACFIAFLYHRNIYGAAVGLWWTAGSVMDCAPYIFDARRGVLPLLGGTTGSEHPDYHDWNNLLRRLGWLQHDQRIGKAVMFVGATLAILALVWGGLLLRRQFKALDLNARPHEWGE